MFAFPRRVDFLVDEHLDACVASAVGGDEVQRVRGPEPTMDGRRGDAETALDVGFGGRPEVDARVGVDEGEILALG